MVIHGASSIKQPASNHTDTIQDNSQMADEKIKSAAGVHVDNEGNRVVGGSLRADGSVRRTVSVRAGYTPVEDIKRYSAREAREERLKEQQDVTDTSSLRRPSRFEALNSVVRINAKEQKKDIPTGVTEKEAPSPKGHNDVVDTGKEEDISADLSKLSLDPEEPSAKEPSPSPAPPTAENPKKKYIPPQRRKKYTLADLDKQ